MLQVLTSVSVVSLICAIGALIRYEWINGPSVGFEFVVCCALVSIASTLLVQIFARADAE